MPGNHPGVLPRTRVVGLDGRVVVTDQAGFEEFVSARSSRLLRVAYLLTRDWALAEDLLQTALVKAWFAWARLDGDPEPYVRKIIVTTCTSWRRRRWVREHSVGELPDQPVRGGMDVVDDRAGLWPALGRLPVRQRAVLVLRFFEDLTEAQTARELGVSVGTVKSQTSKALARLRADTRLMPGPVGPGEAQPVGRAAVAEGM